MESWVFQEFRPDRILHSVTELLYVAASVAEESSGGKLGYPRRLFICNRSYYQKGGLKLIGNVSQNILPTVGLLHILFVFKKRQRWEEKGLTPRSIKFFVSFIKCMLVWIERWKWEFNGHQASKTCSRNILSGRTSDFHLYFYFSQPLDWSALPRLWVGGGGYTYKRKRRADQYILFYTIHFKMPSTPPPAD
jgi:hypothetical protein